MPSTVAEETMAIFTEVPTVAELVTALEADGYAVVRGMLTRAEVDAARAELTPVLAATPLGRNDFEGFRTRRVYALFAKVRAFDALAVHPLLLGVLDQILGHYQLSAPVAIDIGPGETAQVLHHDDAIYPLTHPHREVVVNSIWALDDFTADNGATRLIPGSHRSLGPDAPAGPIFVAEMPAGSMMLYVGSLWHGGGGNVTDRPRLGVLLEYVASWLRPQENHLLAVPHEIARDLPERLQELLGYNIYPPFLGYVDGRHPRRVLMGDTRVGGPPRG
jgi:ectoine hydroxylase-related dioxygenase (phytanoyl-CoA dioxygenase family)